MDARTLRRALVALLVVGIVGASVGAIHAAFSASTSNPSSSFASKRLFPRERATSAWALTDAAGGTATDASSPLAFPERSTGATAVTTGNWANAWSGTRYVEFAFNAPLHGGAPVSGVEFNLTFADSDTATANQWCYYLEVRKVSDGSVVSTHGSTGAPLGCEAAGAFTTVSTALPAITTTDAANDLRIRVYGHHSGGARAVRIDRATVTGSGYAGFTLYPEQHVDSSTGTATTAYWGPAAVNNQAYLTGSFATSYAGTRYLEFSFPRYLPADAIVTGAAFDFTYRSQTAGRNACFYFQVYAGSTLIGSHGSTALNDDVDCNSTASYETIARSLPEVDTPAKANSLVVRVFMKISTAGPVQVDGAVVRVTYSLDAGSGCADPGAQTVTALADAFVDQNAPTATTNGTATTMQVQARTSRNRRALVWFDLPPLGNGCTLTGATLRLYLSATGGARTLHVFKLDGAWQETVSWNTQPTSSGTAAAAATGANNTWLTWDATAHVQAMYSGTNYGLVVHDSAESSGNVTQTFHTHEGVSAPELVLTSG